MSREWDESRVSRHPRGSREGGRFKERWAQELSSQLAPGMAPETYGTSEIAGKNYEAVQARLALCYMMAGHALVLGTAPQGSKLVHGTIHHVLAGRSIEHAWLELPDGSVWEPTQGKTWSPLEWGAIFRPRDTTSYTRVEASAKMLETGNYGPWE